MNANSNTLYRYRLWGINWLPYLLLAAATAGLWSFLKYYDSNRAEELLALKWKVGVQGLGWVTLWFFLSRGWFKIRFLFYGMWSVAVLNEIGQSVYRHDGFRFGLSLILGMLFYGAFSWIETCLDQASVNPRLNWFEGKLSSIPHVGGSVKVGDRDPLDVKVRSVDEAGAFILFPLEGLVPEKFHDNTAIRFKLKFKNQEIEVRGKPIATLDWEQCGLGLQFFFEDLYHQNQYTSLVQQIKGEGLA